MPSEPSNPKSNANARRIGDGPQPPRRPLLPGWMRLLLYPVFSILLFIPAVRRLRRDSRRWNLVRFAAGAVAIVTCGLGAWMSAWWLVGLGVAGLAAAFLVQPSPDPDRERDLQRRHQADYLLNGGRLVSAWPSAPGSGPNPGASLYLLLRAAKILAVSIDGDGEIRGTIEIADVEDILVGGETYRPVYVSEAKDPPVREPFVDKKAKTVMTLALAGSGKVEFEYQGAFSKHLAETAAHAIHSVRQLGAAHGIAGQSPEIFHIVGR
jgi:hypothetical protein